MALFEILSPVLGLSRGMLEASLGRVILHCPWEVVHVGVAGSSGLFGPFARGPTNSWRM